MGDSSDDEAPPTPPPARPLPPTGNKFRCHSLRTWAHATRARDGSSSNLPEPGAPSAPVSDSKQKDAEKVVEWALNMAGVATRPPVSKRQRKRANGRLRKAISEKPVRKSAMRPEDATTAGSPPGTSALSQPSSHPASEDANTALVGGVWQTDASRHTLDGRLKGRDTAQGTVRVEARKGFPTLRVAYFFSGVERKASIAENLKRMCEEEGFGLILHEVDTLVGGEAHDLLKSESQDAWIKRVEDGEFDVLIHSPPCGSWSRANWANNLKPQPCRDRQNPWGFPTQAPGQRRRAEKGNVFVHFTIRAIIAGQTALARGHRVASLLEHPEDLGMTSRGEPASIWQLQDLRKAFGNAKFLTVAGHQCQFGVDRKKPTRLYTDMEGFEDFGHVGWPVFDAGGWYVGPLPKDCGHGDHKEAMIGHAAGGEGFNTSPTAAYPPEMCQFIAVRIFRHWRKHLRVLPPVGMGATPKSRKSATGAALLEETARSGGARMKPAGEAGSASLGKASDSAWDAPLVEPGRGLAEMVSEA